jgi:hypothetical protein
MFRGEIEQIEDQVYEKFGVSREAFKSVCESKYADNV